jgi:general secretion pathway protein I
MVRGRKKNSLLRLPSMAGFTLLEVMVSVTIIAIALVTLIGSQSRSVSIATISRFDTVASLLARQKMSELALGGFDELQSAQGDFGEDFAEFSWQVEVKDLGESDTGIEGAEEVLRLVELVVSSAMNDEQTFYVRQVMMAAIEPEEKP